MQKNNYTKWLAMDSFDMPIGINMIIQNSNGEILLSKRAGHRTGAGSWGLVGGKLKTGESFEETAIRELKEEINLSVTEDNLEVINFANCADSKTVHFLQVGVLVKNWSGEIKNMEPDKCSDLKFFKLNQLPTELFFATKCNIELFLKNKFYDKQCNFTYKK